MATRDEDRLTIRETTDRESRALQLIAERPGITVAELAETLDVSVARGRKIVDILRGRIGVQRALLPIPDDLAPPGSFRSLPPEVARARAQAARTDQRIAAVVSTRIAGHIATYSLAVDALDLLHQRIADETDIDLVADSRWAAMWQLSGRAIGYARTVIVLANAGIGDEALPTARAMHECVRLLDSVTYEEDGQLLVRWLADEDDDYVRPRDARAAVEAGERRLAAAMTAAGEEPAPSTRALSETLYHRMSLVAHNRRQAIEMTISPHLRLMARGSHPSAVERAQAVLSLGAIVEEVLLLTGPCLATFLGERAGTAWLNETLRPTLATFAAVRADQPLEEDSINMM